MIPARPILAIDAGNTNLVLQVRNKIWRIETHSDAGFDDFPSRLLDSLSREGFQIQDFESIALASVVPAVTACLRQAFPEIRVIDHTWPFSFRISTTHPAQTGIDRLVNAEAVFRDYAANAIIVDAGTATTIDALTSDRGFRGGAILAGIQACRDALTSKTAQLFKTELTPPPQVIGADTETALRSGLVLGYASMLDGMIARFKKEMPENSRVILTGGLSPLLRGICTELGPASNAVTDPELTLKGIHYVYESFRHR